MKVVSLGSGSAGNSFLLEADGTRVLIDAGLSGRRLARRLEAVEVEPESIDALVVTHDHRDHTAGVGVAARRWGWPVYLSRSTAVACRSLFTGEERLRPLSRGVPLALGGLEIHPFLTCHDAADPLAVTVVARRGGLRVGVATDLGRATTTVRAALAGCHFLVLEANHDEVLLREGPYPWSVKHRIGGSRGHLSNRLAGELGGELAHAALGGVLLAHLSVECNEPDRARDVVGEALEGAGYRGPIEVASQTAPSQRFDVEELVGRTGGVQLDLFGGRAGEPGS